METKAMHRTIFQTALEDQNPNYGGGTDVWGFSKVARQPYTLPNDDFVQPGNLYRSAMSDVDREHLIGNIASHLKNAYKEIQIRQTQIFYKVDPEYGQRIAEKLRDYKVRKTLENAQKSYYD